MERIKGANGELMKYSMQPMDGKGHLTLYRYDQLAVGGADNAHLEFWIEIEELRKQLADAQATIAALQAERDGWVRSREHYYQLWIRAIDERDEMRKERDDFESQLTQRTAELEAAQREARLQKEVEAALSSKVAEYEVELNGDPQNFYGRGRTVGLRTLIAALPKVEGAVVVSNGYVKDSTRCHALFGADEDAALYAALLKHRQGMEG